MKRNALVIHGNKCTSSIFIFMLRFSVDFLWISMSEGTVRFSLCLEQKCFQASPSPWALPNTLVYMKWLRKHFFSYFSYLHNREINSYLFLYSNHGLKYHKLWWRSPNISGWILWFFLKRACLCAPELLPGTAEHWEGLLSIPRRPHPSDPAQVPEVHTSRAKEGWLTHSQSLELHLPRFLP